jgi:UbiD family decarboxylase
MKETGLRAYLEVLKKTYPDEFVMVKKEIGPKFEITALVAKLELQRKWPVLLFENVKGTSFPVLTNLHARRQRLGLALGCEPRKMVQTYLERIQSPVQSTNESAAPVKEVVKSGQDANVFDLPRIWHHDGDSAPYLTGAIAIAKDPETQRVNASYNRLMMKDKDKFGIHLTEGKQLWNFYKTAEKLGKPLEVAFVIGNHPCIALGSLHVSAGGETEIDVMNCLMQEPIAMTSCESIDLDVPAYSEMIIEGEILPEIREEEGPFGEFTGYSLGERKREVVKVKAICYRRDAIFQDISVGHLDHLLLSTIPMEANLLRAVKASVPTVVSVRIPAPFTVFISIEKRTEGQGMNAITAALGAEMYLKNVVVVDHDINIYDTHHVLWAISTRVQPHRDILLIPSSRGSDLDPSCTVDGLTSRMGIDATASPSLAEFTPRHQIPKDILDRIKPEEYLNF